MSETSERLNLPFIMPNQAQKHVTHNEAIDMLDALTQLVLVSIGEDDPPASPSGEACYAIGDNPTGDWTGHSGKVAAYQETGWRFFSPQAGWIALDVPNSEIVFFDGSEWLPAQNLPEAIQNLSFIGINSTADTTNRLAVSSPAILLNHAGNDHQLKINKNASRDHWPKCYSVLLAG
ncbi:MAG: DUF2793 domain-containing protein, partial [Pseudomonadota bacterium]